MPLPDATPAEMRLIAEELEWELRILMTASGMARAQIEREVERVILTAHSRYAALAARQGQRPMLRVVR